MRTMVSLPVLGKDGLAHIAAARQAAEDILGPLEPAGPAHLTLVYLGDVEAPHEILAKVGAIAERAAPFVLASAGLAAFPAREGITPIVVAYPEGGPVEALHLALLRALAPEVEAGQFEAFRPHVTLGYLPRELTAEEAGLLAGASVGTAWTAGAVEVVADDLVLATWFLHAKAFANIPGAGAEVIPPEHLPLVVSPALDPDPYEAHMTALPDTVRHLSCLVDRALSTEEDAATRVRWRFVASEAIEDRMKDVVEQDWDLSEFKLNSILLFAHKGDTFPIGRVERIVVENGRLMADVVIDDVAINPWGQLVAHLIRQKMLNAVSVGFRSGECIARTSLPAGHPHKGTQGYLLRKNKLMELSVVPIPALQTALVQRGLADEGGPDNECDPMVATMQGFLAQATMSGQPDEDYVDGMIRARFTSMALSLAYLSVGTDAAVRNTAAAHLKSATDRIAALTALRAARAAGVVEPAAAVVEAPMPDENQAAIERGIESPAPAAEPLIVEVVAEQLIAGGLVDRLLAVPTIRARVEAALEAERLAQPQEPTTAEAFFARALGAGE